MNYPPFLQAFFDTNRKGRAIPVDPVITAASELARHGADMRRKAERQRIAERADIMRAMQNDPALRPDPAIIQAELDYALQQRRRARGLV